MSRLVSCYHRLPIAFQHLACTAEGWRIARDRYGPPFHALLREGEERSRWPQEAIAEWRDKRLRAFLVKALDVSPFHRERFRAAGIGPEDIRSLDDLRALPAMAKADAHAMQATLDAGGAARSRLRQAHTSGTTGAGFQFSLTAGALREQWAVWWRYRRWHGIEPGTWSGCFNGRSLAPITQTAAPFWRYNLAGRQILFSAYHFNRRNLPHYVAELRRRRPPWLHGYPSLLSLLAAYLVETGTDLGYQPRWITTGAETLLSQQANLMTRAFGVRPKQHYGMAEAAANFSECEHGRMHVDEDFAAVEFVPAADRKVHRVIGTNLSNPATPLIRYGVGDHVTLEENFCPCGRPGRIVTSIDGRIEDYIVLPDETRIGRLDHVFKDLTHVHEAQLYQRRVDEIVIRIVQGQHYSDHDEQLLVAEMRARVGSRVRLQITYVDRLERSRTGKLRFIVSELAEGRVDRVTI
jgi:phenylacetate-CoA ligase